MRCATLRTLLVFVGARRRRRSRLPAFVSDFRAQQFAYVGIYLIALIGLERPHRLHGPDLARARRVHGDRRLYDGDPDDRSRRQGHLDDPARDRRRRCGAGSCSGSRPLRLSGLYLALATFAIAVATPAVIKRFEGFTGGGSGMNLFGTPRADGLAHAGAVRSASSSTSTTGSTTSSWTVALVGYVLAWLLLRGRTGRAFRAVRDSETAAVSSGVSLARYEGARVRVSAAYAGAAGALFAIATTYVNPDTFPVALSIFLLVGVVVAGLGSLTG